MTRFVIDALTLLELVDGRCTVDPAHQLVAPNSIRSEALDLLLRKVRSDDLTDRHALELHERMTEVKIRTLGDRVSRRTAWAIARDHDCSIRIAEYIALAKLQADALIAADADLLKVARGVVPLAQLTEVTARS